MDINKIDTSNIKKIEIEKQIKEGSKDRYDLTYECYLEGLSLEDIAKKRDFTIDTIIKHLEKCEKRGGDRVDWSRFIDDPNKEKKDTISYR